MNYIIALFAVCILFAGCDKFENSAEPSNVTYLPKITVMGETDVTLPCDGGTFTDPGATAEEAGQSIDLVTAINPAYFGGSTIDGPDKYIISYSATNKDGIPGAATREVYWPECNGDLVNSIAGTYTAYLSRTTKSSGAVLASAQYQGVGPIIIRDLGGGMYGISDAIGGWYEFGRSLGVPYTATGQTITAVDIPNNQFTFGPPVEVGAFGGLNTITSLTVNPADESIDIVTDWEAGYIFEIHLEQN